MNNLSKLSDLGAMANASSLAELCEAYDAKMKRKKELAEKVLKSKGLTKEEKHEIYLSLTTEEPATIKKGRPSKINRDMDFALDYLETKYDKKWTGINPIAIRHAIKTNDQTTVYKALNRGLKELEVDSKADEQAANNMLSKINENSPLYPRLKWLASESRYKLVLIELHRLHKETR